jgi:hypothetical protein
MSAPSTGLSKAERRALTSASGSPSSWEGRPILPEKFNDRVTLTLPEVAKLLRISRWAAYEAAKSGQLRTITLGRRKMVPKRVVENLLLAGNSEPEE